MRMWWWCCSCGRWPAWCGVAPACGRVAVGTSASREPWSSTLDDMATTLKWSAKRCCECPDLRPDNWTLPPAPRRVGRRTTPGSRAAVLRRSEQTRVSSARDDEVGGLHSAIRAEQGWRAAVLDERA